MAIFFGGENGCTKLSPPPLAPHEASLPLNRSSDGERFNGALFPQRGVDSDTAELLESCLSGALFCSETFLSMGTASGKLA